MPELVRKLRDKKTVVFHCALSQERGPRAARLYFEERGRMEKGRGGVDKRGGQSGQGEGGEEEGGEEGGKEEGGEGEGEGEGEQEVYVLDKGFVGWQEM